MATSHPRYSLPPVGPKPSLNRHASYTSSPRLDDHARSAPTVPTHARLHKRGTSDSSAPTGSPTTSHSPDLAVLASRSMDTPTSSSQEEGRRSLDFVSARRLRPYLRKLHTREDNSLDLSLPAPDSGSPAGLGIHDYATGPRSVADVHFASANRRHNHNRSTSGNSLNSASSGGLRQPTAPFLRHTPRQISDLSEHSRAGSIHEENDRLPEASDIMSDDEYVYRQGIFDPQRRSGSMSSSTPNAPAPIHSLSSGSISRMPSRSQTSLSNLYDHTRSRRDTMKSDLAHSPSSRTSLDKAIGFVRGRESPVDPASRAASIRALRAEFQAKEEAKERKAEKEALRKRDREERKRAKTEDRYQRPEMEEINEKTVDDPPAIPPRPVSGQTTHHNSNAPPYVLQSNTTRTTRATANKKRTRRPIKGRWAAFVAWFRTRLLRLKCL